MIKSLKLKNISVSNLDEFYTLFLKKVLGKPLILILDEFDSLTEDAISGRGGAFWNIYNNRKDDLKPSAEKEYLRHGSDLDVPALLGLYQKYPDRNREWLLRDVPRRKTDNR